MSVQQAWVKCPTKWIVEDNGLLKLKAIKGSTSANIAALMCLTIILHHADQETGLARVTYDQFEQGTGKSRSTVSSGIQKLMRLKLIEKKEKQSYYQIVNFNPSKGWGKFPLKSMYNGNTVLFFDECNLRLRAELDALKILFLIVAYRDQNYNLAFIGYDKIVEKTGIRREYIKRAIALLATHGLAYPEVQASSVNEYGVSHGYRIRGIDPHIHGGTRSRRDMSSRIEL